MKKEYDFENPPIRDPEFCASPEGQRLITRLIDLANAIGRSGLIPYTCRHGTHYLVLRKPGACSDWPYEADVFKLPLSQHDFERLKSICTERGIEMPAVPGTPHFLGHRCSHN